MKQQAVCAFCGKPWPCPIALYPHRKKRAKW